ncbi:hypothetical protein P9597_03410 [Aneurinibacillus migulanus]|uniref:hypothetical protein n=1 Tax=Aneurinibacillus migulanus TaxID=47500 RepID=UPI002E22F29A|nr:hypothetical protein [Aneurinibacillus migulanus]
MLEKIKFYLSVCLASSILGAFIVGVNIILKYGIHLVTGRAFHFHITSVSIIFSIVFISSFGYAVNKGPAFIKE